MAQELNREGVAVPTVGRIVMYHTEGKVWAAVVTEVVDAHDLQIRLTAFPPGESPRGIAAVVPFWQGGEESRNHTWAWPNRV